METFKNHANHTLKFSDVDPWYNMKGKAESNQQIFGNYIFQV